MKATHAELPGGRAAGRTPAEASQAATSEGDKTFRAYAPEQLLLMPPALATGCQRIIWRGSLTRWWRRYWIWAPSTRATRRRGVGHPMIRGCC